jgi:hypothetical protein
MSVAITEPRATHLGMPAEDARPRRRPGRVYLVLAALLAPMCVPAGPGQSAALDVLNLIAIAAFALFVVGPGRQSLRVPLAIPMGLVAVGSLIACAWAPSLGQAALSLAQDVYLFASFLVAVNVIRTRRDLRAVRIAWVVAAVAVSLVAVGQLVIHNGGSLGSLFGSRGLRPPGTLYNPNMLADYLMTSVFVAMSLAAEVRRLPLVLATGVIGFGLLVTKSNGGMIAFAAGLITWCAVGIAIGPSHRRGGLIAATALLATLAGVTVWLNAEWGLADGALRSLKEQTFVGRMEKSSASRMRIWDQLERAYARSPLGIGPGNSNALTVGIADRERPDSYRSKEAHSDYLGYAIERGPLGLMGLLGFVVATYLYVARYWQGSRHASGRTPRRAALWTASMAAVLTASAVHSMVIEKLHFRHFWLFIALVCGSALMASERPADGPVDAPAEVA